jgi:hypothetical protein
MSMRPLLRPLLALPLLLAACQGTPDTTATSSTGVGGHGGATTTSSSTGGATTTSTPTDAGPDITYVDDGAPTRVACTSNFGSGLTVDHGRLDGILVAIVPVTQKSCNGDSSHVHLQVRSKGATYDVAVNTDVLFAERDHAMPGGAWTDGWHAGVPLDYVKDFVIHSGNFATLTADQLAQKVEQSLASANHVSIFATGYGSDGVHNVHRRGGGYNDDGAIVLEPLSPVPHVLMFCFSDQGF